MTDEPKPPQPEPINLNQAGMIQNGGLNNSWWPRATPLTPPAKITSVPK
jgi:hypothetical protein